MVYISVINARTLQITFLHDIYVYLKFLIGVFIQTLSIYVTDSLMKHIVRPLIGPILEDRDMKD